MDKDHQLPKPPEPPNVNAFPYHLLFPTPIPEPPRVISSKPLVSDVSITSEVDGGRGSTKARVKFKAAAKTPTVRAPSKPSLRSKQSTTTTSIYPTDDHLQRLRRRYGLVDDNGYSSDEEDEDEDESIIYLKEVKKSGTRRKLPITNAKQNHQNNAIRARMEQVQNDLRQQFEKLQVPPTETPEVDFEISTSSGVSSDSARTTESSNTNANCNCKKAQQVLQKISLPLPLPKKQPNLEVAHSNSNQQSSSQANDQQMLEYIRKQDQQLQQISKQIDELLRIHKPETDSRSDCSTTTASTTKSSPKKITKSIQTMTTASIIHETTSGANTTEYRQLPTHSAQRKPKSTFKDVNSSKRASGQTVPKQIYVPSGSDYLDSSIEKARRELKQTLLHSSSPSASPESSDSEIKNLHQKNISSSSSADMYTNMISTINSILVRNGSFESSSGIGDDSRSSGNSGNRSSCSETEVFLQRTPKTSSPKQQHHKRTTIIRQTKIQQANRLSSPKTAHSVRKRFLHSEQSLYIEKLASKYEVLQEEEEEVLIEDIEDLDGRPKSPTDELLDRYHYDREYDAAVYCLSDHNTSFATKAYLEKYKLTQTPPQQQNKAKLSLPHTKTTTTSRQQLMLPKSKLAQVDEEQEFLPDFRLFEGSPKSAAEVEKKKVVREVKSRTADGFSRILDLEAIKSLPKLT